MAERSELLLKQAEELFSLRERNIQNIGSSASSYFTVLGLILTALAILLDQQDLAHIDPFLYIVLIIAGIAIYCFGWFTRKNIWSSYVNQLFYTRKLNMTRFYLAKIINTDIEKHILLPIDGNTPKFDEKGFLGQTFSKDDVVRVLTFTNTFTVFATVFGITMLILNNLGGIHIIISIGAAFGVAGIIYDNHDQYDIDIKNDANTEWEKRILGKEKTKGMIYS